METNGDSYVKKLFLAIFALFPAIALAQPAFFGGMVSQGTGSSQSGSFSAGASAGPGFFLTGGTSAAESQSGATAGATLVPGSLQFNSAGATATNTGSAVGGISGGNALQTSVSGSGAQASEYHASGFVIVLP